MKSKSSSSSICVICGFILAAASGYAAEWDFTKGVPSGGRIRSGAVVSESGLSALQPTNCQVAAGFVLDRVLTMGAAFAIEAEVVAGPHGQVDSRMTHKGNVWDSMDKAVDMPTKECRGVRLQLSFRFGKCTPSLYVGRGDHNIRCEGPSRYCRPGDVMRIRVEYTANRKVVWKMDGKTTESYVAESGAPIPAVSPAVIGDRLSPKHAPYNGSIRFVRVEPLVRQPLVVKAVSRTVFRRDEESARIELAVENFSPGVISNLEVQVGWDARIPGRKITSVGALPSGESASFGFCFDPRVRPGRRTAKVSVTGVDANGRAVAVEQDIAFGIAPIHAERMPLMMTDSMEDVCTLKELGMNVGQWRGNFMPPDRSGLQYAVMTRLLDEAALNGIDISICAEDMVPLPPGIDPREFARIDRQGQPFMYKRHGRPVYSLELSDPRELDYIRDFFAGWGKLIGSYPAYTFQLFYGEMRDHAEPSFGNERMRFEADTGLAIPPEVVTKTVSPEIAAQKYPDGLVPDDDPLLVYYRWYWKGGDGWPAFISQCAAGLKDGVKRSDLNTFWNPAVRCPPIWGSGGRVSHLSHWVYAHPEPMGIAGPTEELFAMAEGKPGQKVMAHLQGMCYRKRVAPHGVAPESLPSWYGEYSTGDFIAIPTDAFLEGVWSALAKPISGFSTYPLQSFVDTGCRRGYVYSNPELGKVAEALFKGVVAPLGPMLLRLGREVPDVAVLESFTSTVMGMRHGRGSSAPPVTFLQRARLDPRVVYEETLLRDGTDGIKVLYAPACRYLTQRMLTVLRKFQANGGILIGDDELNPSLKADIVVPCISFEAPPKYDMPKDVVADLGSGDVARMKAKTMARKMSMVEAAAILRDRLTGRYEGRSDSSSAEIVTYNRRWRDVDYLFAVNDRRTFGDYVGQWGQMMEKGLPTEGWVSVKDPECAIKVVYEMSKGGRVDFLREGEKVKVPVAFSTTDGRLFAFLRQEIAGIRPECSIRGERIHLTITVIDGEGNPVHALLPVEAHVYASDGVEVDGAGYLAAEDGIAQISIPINHDDPDGQYLVTCRDVLTGQTANVSVR